MLTIKFVYNLSVDVNIILKKGAKDAFGVLKSFDLDIIAKGYDLESGEVLDLSQNLPNKKCSWNKWNSTYYSKEPWAINRILRQMDRCIKYYRRGYDTDDVVLKYIELIDIIQNHDSVFNSDTYSIKLNINKKNTKIIKQICQLWLKTHEISEDELDLLRSKLREI